MTKTRIVLVGLMLFLVLVGWRVNAGLPSDVLGLGIGVVFGQIGSLAE